MTTVFSKYIQHQFVKRPVLFETADSEKNLFDEMQTTVSLTHTHYMENDAQYISR